MSPAGRVLWLLEQLDNYIQRWLSLREASPTIAPGDDDLFCMIEIGAETVSAELIAAKIAVPAEPWQDFLALLASLRANERVLQSQGLSGLLADVRSAVPLR